jgi:hypothetical protein
MLRWFLAGAATLLALDACFYDWSDGGGSGGAGGAGGAANGGAQSASSSAQGGSAGASSSSTTSSGTGGGCVTTDFPCGGEGLCCKITDEICILDYQGSTPVPSCITYEGSGCSVGLSCEPNPSCGPNGDVTCAKCCLGDANDVTFWCGNAPDAPCP